MRRLMEVVIAFALTLLVWLAATRTAHGEAGTASPIMGDHVRAGRARAGVRTINSSDVTGRVIESSDPQIHGMKAAGAKDATYQAAYRSCMRRKGF